jgi:hypothetical protein
MIYPTYHQELAHFDQILILFNSRFHFLQIARIGLKGVKEMAAYGPLSHSPQGRVLPTNLHNANIKSTIPTCLVFQPGSDSVRFTMR